NVAALADGGLMLLTNGTVEQEEEGGVEKIEGLSEVAAVSPGTALKRNGTVWQWEWEEPGSSHPRRTTPKEVPLPEAAVAIASSPSARDRYAVLSDGKVMGWGINSPVDEEELGIGTVTGPDQCGGQIEIACANVPTELVGLSGVSKLSAVSGALVATAAEGTTVSGWHATGSLYDGKHRESSAVSGSFSGHGPVKGQVFGTLSTTVSYGFAGLPLTFGINLSIEPSGTSVELTSFGIGKWFSIPVRCPGHESGQVADQPSVITSSEIALHGSFRFPWLDCSGAGWSGATLGWIVSALLSGPTNEYNLVMQP
ncbi:MAG: RCC1 domain-containing protein, partial [Solirubrobacteraceae bacterium]